MCEKLSSNLENGKQFIEITVKDNGVGIQQND